MYQNWDLYIDGKYFFGHYFIPTKETKCLVILVHGIGEHTGRFQHVAEKFNNEGIAIIGADLLGHGLSEGKRGHAAPRQRIFQAIDKMIDLAVMKYKDIPIFLYGHSMGGNIVLDYCTSGNSISALTGFIITSPWIIIKKKIGRVLKIAVDVMAKFKPDITVYTGVSGKELTTELKGYKAYIKDPLVHGKISLMTYLDNDRAAKRVLKKDNFENNTKPILLMHGSSDSICLVSGSRKAKENIGELCDYIEWPYLYHELHNEETYGDKVIQIMIDWIYRHI